MSELSSFPCCVANPKGSFTVDLAIILMENTGFGYVFKGLNLQTWSLSYLLLLW